MQASLGGIDEQCRSAVNEHSTQAQERCIQW
jgi:hypothetical protein